MRWISGSLLTFNLFKAGVHLIVKISLTFLYANNEGGHLVFANLSTCIRQGSTSLVTNNINNIDIWSWLFGIPDWVPWLMFSFFLGMSHILWGFLFCPFHMLLPKSHFFGGEFCFHCCGGGKFWLQEDVTSVSLIFSLLSLLIYFAFLTFVNCSIIGWYIFSLSSLVNSFACEIVRFLFLFFLLSA